MGCRCSEHSSHQHSWETIQSLLEGAIVGAANRGEAKASEELLEEHERLSQDARVQAAKLEPMHIIDWGDARRQTPP